MTRRSGCAVVVTLLIVAGCAESAPARFRDSAARFAEPARLPAPDTRGRMSLDIALSRRRSAHAFSSRPLPLALIGQLLWAGQGITSPDGKRTAPSAGGRYPIELYVVTAHQVMHYLPDGHRIEMRSDGDRRRELADAAFGQDAVASAPAVIVVAAVPARTRAKYGARRTVRRPRSRARNPEHPPRSDRARLGRRPGRRPRSRSCPRGPRDSARRRDRVSRARRLPLSERLHGALLTSTGQRAIPTTPIVTLPSATRAVPARAWLLIATRSASTLSAKSAIAPAA